MAEWKELYLQHNRRPLSERYAEAAKDLDNIVLELINENKRLEEELRKTKIELKAAYEREDRYVDTLKEWTDFLSHITPLKVYHSKSRDNTTVKFANGKSVTVHKTKEDKDCLETAIVYAVFKNAFGMRELNKLVENHEETGGEKCKKN